MVLFIMLYKVVLTFESVDEGLQIKAIELHFPVVLSKSFTYFLSIYSR